MKAKFTPVNFIGILVAALLTAILCGPALADQLDPLDPLLIGISSDNDKDVSGLIEKYNLGLSEADQLPEELTLLGKYEENNGFSGLTLNTYESTWFKEGSQWVKAPEGSQGYWTLDSTVSSGPIFFSVKAGNNYALYYAGDLWESYWNTYDVGGIPHENKHGSWIELRNMSHISFWTAAGEPPPDTPTNPVPEPATLLLLGVGVLGLSRTARKSFS